MIFKKDTRKAPAEIGHTLNVFHKFFEYGKEEDEKKISEFLIHKIYGWEVVVTNISSYKKNFNLLWQIPEGSIPLEKAHYLKSDSFSLDSYSTLHFKYFFYFPNEGNFIQFPSNISIRNKIVAVAKIHKFNVVSKLTPLPTGSFKDVLLTKNLSAVYDFLKTNNLFEERRGFSFKMILWMLKDKNIFNQVTKILRKRRIYVEPVWKFAFYHLDEKAVKGKHLFFWWFL